MRKVLLLFIVLNFVSDCFSQTQEPIVIISTYLGNVKVKLYNNTPNHRDAFLKLIEDKHFEETLFYRVVENFVIQGGSSDSRNAPRGKHIGYGSSTLIIDSEFRKENIHKKGAICAPRQPEHINHFKMSDISQFYLVKGRVYTDEELDLLEKATNNPIKIALKKELYVPFKEVLAQLKTEDPKAFNARLREIKDEIAFRYSVSDKLEFTEKQREIYTTLGGLPELDGDYTVFGEVVEGLDIIDRLSFVKTDENSRPLKDIKLILRQINK